MLVLLICFVSQFVLYELTGTILSFDHLHLAFSQGLLLGLSNHHINVLRFGFVVLSLLKIAYFVLLKLLLGRESSIPSLILRFCLAIVDSIGLIFFTLTMLLSFHLLFHSSFLLHMLLLSKSVEVSLALVDDLTSSLLSFINFADSLSFFTLKKTNTVNKKSEVFLSLFAGLLGKDELSVKSLIVIVFIWSQVNLLELLVVEVLLLHLFVLIFRGLVHL